MLRLATGGMQEKVRRRWWFGGLILFAALAAGIYFFRPSPGRTPPAPDPGINVAENRYVDASVCADCHPVIAEIYLRTGMGHSFSRPTIGNTAGAKKNPATFYHKASDSYFTMVERDGRLFQRRFWNEISLQNIWPDSLWRHGD